MEHLGTICLETERLILRRFTVEDAQAMFRNWASDEEVTKFLTWPAHRSAEVSRRVLEDWVAGDEKPDFYQWAIVPRNFGEPIGTISVVDQDDRCRKAHIGYCIGRNWWHQGMMSEALEAVMDFLFDAVISLILVEDAQVVNPFLYFSARYSRSTPGRGPLLRFGEGFSRRVGCIFPPSGYTWMQTISRRNAYETNQAPRPGAA